MHLKTPISRGGKGIPKKLEIWEESIGIVALVQLCPLLSSLDLSGCFRLNRVLGKSISTLQYLKILNLKGCNQVTSKKFLKFRNFGFSVQDPQKPKTKNHHNISHKKSGWENLSTSLSLYSFDHINYTTENVQFPENVRGY